MTTRDSLRHDSLIPDTLFIFAVKSVFFIVKSVAKLFMENDLYENVRFSTGDL
jgi:hypothetical protein